MLKATTEDYLRELRLLAHHLQETQREVLQRLEEPILLEVELPTYEKAYFLISSEGIRQTTDTSSARHTLSLTYRDLLRIIEKPSRIVRYILEGRVKVRGDYRKILSTLQNLV